MARSPQERESGGVALGPIEHRMRLKELLDRAAGQGGATALPDREKMGPYLAVSRQAGSGGAEVARRVGERLGWSVLDRELVEGLARKLELSPKLLELMDETRANWFSDTLLNLMNSRLVTQHSYVALLGKVTALAASEGRVVFVGRGAHLMLPRAAGLSVRVVASMEFCVRQIREREGLDERAATRRVEELDASRADFIRRQFHRDPDDPRLYDLVIDTSVFGIDGAVELIQRAVELRGMA
jgi:cytidylate kinase